MPNEILKRINFIKNNYNKSKVKKINNTAASTNNSNQSNALMDKIFLNQKLQFTPIKL